MNLRDMSVSEEEEELIARALAEDMHEAGDITSDALVPEDYSVDAAIVARNACVVAGVLTVAAVFRKVDPSLEVHGVIADGQPAAADDTVVTVSGSARSILAGERTALNFIQRLTGIATLTAAFIEKVKGHNVDILDTRKTTPGLRTLEKYAVRCGGGRNHRMGLFDMALVKDNHKRVLLETVGCDLSEAAGMVRRHSPGKLIEIEVETEQELADALKGSPDWVLLDNMSPEVMRKCVALCAGKCKLEASGGITLDNVEAMAATGVDAISLGCLTHSAPSADLSLEFVD